MLPLDYARQTGAADLSVMQAIHIVQIGIGSAKKLPETLVRMGASQITVIDPDVVELRNVTSQGYTYADALAARPKVLALQQECQAINPAVKIIPIQEDFVHLPHEQVKEILADADLLIMTTDHHPAQARGALAGLVCDVPVILASLYRRGRAGEIVYTFPGLNRACYRCITKDRYAYVAQHRTSGTGNGTGSLPFAPAFVHGIVGHLAVAMLHKRKGVDNPFAHWIDQIGQRNFIQTRMDPAYRLGDEDIFGEVFGHGEKIFAFDTIWQPGETDPKCPDCHGQGAIPVGERQSQSTELEPLSCGCLIQRDPTIRNVCPACSVPLMDAACKV